MVLCPLSHLVPLLPHALPSILSSCFWPQSQESWIIYPGVYLAVSRVVFCCCFFLSISPVTYLFSSGKILHILYQCILSWKLPNTCRSRENSIMISDVPVLRTVQRLSRFATVDSSRDCALCLPLSVSGQSKTLRHHAISPSFTSECVSKS